MRAENRAAALPRRMVTGAAWYEMTTVPSARVANENGASPGCTDSRYRRASSLRADTIAPMDAEPETTSPPGLPLGRSGRLEAIPLAAAGDHALYVRETGPDRRGRVLLTTDKVPAGERLVVVPLDAEVEVRIDGDALAVWIGGGSLEQLPPEQRPIEHAHVPVWATLVGGALLALVLAFAVIGSGVAFSWLLRLLGAA